MFFVTEAHFSTYNDWQGPNPRLCHSYSACFHFLFWHKTDKSILIYWGAIPEELCRKSWVTQITYSGSALTLAPIYRISGQNQLQKKSQLPGLKLLKQQFRIIGRKH